jgi:hypothetical protein
MVLYALLPALQEVECFSNRSRFLLIQIEREASASGI